MCFIKQERFELNRHSTPIFEDGMSKQLSNLPYYIYGFYYSQVIYHHL